MHGELRNGISTTTVSDKSTAPAAEANAAVPLKVAKSKKAKKVSQQV